MRVRNREWMIYTYRHRRAFEYCVKKLIKEPGLRARMLERARVHDMDKQVMYLFMDQQAAQTRHVMTQPHHLENDLPRTHDDLVETVIDYECAPYTKPDKPLNAYDFTLKLMDMGVLDHATGGKLIDIMGELGIARSGTVAEDDEGLAYCRGIGEVGEEEVLKEIIRYVAEAKDNSVVEMLDGIEN